MGRGVGPMRRRAVAFVVAIVTAGVVLPAGVSGASPGLRLDVNPVDDFVAVHDAAPGIPPVRITITNPGESAVTFDAYADLGGNALVGTREGVPDIVPGAIVTADQEGSLSASLTVVDLGIRVVKPETGLVIGWAPAGTTQVDVWVSDQAVTRGPIAVTPDEASGDWVGDFSAIGGITYTMQASALLHDAEGDGATAIWKRTPRAVADANGFGMRVEGFSPFTTVHLDVYPQENKIGGPKLYEITGATDLRGNFRYEFPWDPVNTPLVEDNAVVATQSVPDVPAAEVVSKTLVFHPVTITLVNPTNETVTGTAPDQGRWDVSVSVDGSSGHADRTLTSQQGSWTANFAPYDIGGDAGAYAMSIDAQQDGTGDFRFAPRLTAEPGLGRFGSNSGIEAEGFPGGASLDLEVFAAPGEPLRYSTTIPADSDGRVQTGLPLFLVHGNVVRLSDPVMGVTKEIGVFDLTIVRVDPVADFVTGTSSAPEGSRIWLRAEGCCEFATSTTVQAGGTWGATFDIPEWAGAEAWLFDDDGDALKKSKGAPALNVQLDRDEIQADDFAPGTPVTFDVFAQAGDATPVFTGVRVSDGAGSADLGPDRLQRDLVPGNRVQVSDGVDTREVTLGALTMTVNTAVTPSNPDPNLPQPRYGLEGTAPLGSSIFIGTGFFDWTGEPRSVNSDGTWSFPVEENSVGPETGVGVSIASGDGAGTGVGKPRAGIEVDPVSNTVHVVGFLPAVEPVPGETVDLTIFDTDGQTVLLGPIGFTADALGEVSLGFGDHGVDLEPGHVVEARGEATNWTQRMTVSSLTFTEINSNLDRVSGTGPAGKDLEVRLDNGVGDFNRTTTIDPNGNWVFDLASVFDVTPGTVGEVRLHPWWDSNLTTARGPVSATVESTTGGAVTTDIAGDGATAGDPVETTVEVPAGTAGGEVSVTESEVTEGAPSGYSFLEQQVNVTAPSASPGAPLVLTFLIDAVQLGGITADDVAVFRNGNPVGPCQLTTPGIDPDPCVSQRLTLADGDAQITVLTSEASVWNFGVADPLGEPTLSANPIGVGTTSQLSVTPASGATLDDIEYFVGADPGAGNGQEMGWNGSAWTASVGAGLEPGHYQVGVRGLSASGWSQAKFVYLVVYSRTGSLSGGGTIVPGGPTSDPVPADALPGLDGVSRADFSLSAKYGKGATVPAGTLSFSYPGFSLSSSSLSWLVVNAAPVSSFQGTAVVNGTGGYTFRVEITDGSPDRFELRVWAPGQDADRSAPLYQATGALTSGQIRIRR